MGGSGPFGEGSGGADADRRRELPDAPGPADLRHARRPERQGRAGQPAQLGRQGLTARAVPAEATDRLRDRRRRPKPDACRRTSCTIAWQSASLLLDYPDEALLGAAADLIRSASQRLPAADRRLAARGSSTTSSARRCRSCQADYVETFDNRRRCNLFLTYFAHGDTRKRGMALLRFKQTYLRAGLRARRRRAARPPLRRARVRRHRATGRWAATCCSTTAPASSCCGSRCATWARRGRALLDAVSATLPPLRGDERDAVRRLAAEGPPEEEVGLAPFAAPQFSPAPRQSAAERPCCPCRRSRERAR